MRRTRVADVAMLIASVVVGIGSVAMFTQLHASRWVDMGWTDSLALPWDALLSLAFFVQHSGMVRRSVRARMAVVVPHRYQGAVYSIASGVVLALLVVFWQRSDTMLWRLEGAARWVAQALSLFAVVAFVLAAVSLRRSFDPLGLRPIRSHLDSQPEDVSEFVVRGPYRWVRHPLYSCLLVLFWATPDVTADQLLLSLIWTAWIWVGTMLEERDLVAEFGQSYRAYQRQVPMLIPWRGQAAPATVTAVGDEARHARQRGGRYEEHGHLAAR